MFMYREQFFVVKASIFYQQHIADKKALEMELARILVPDQQFSYFSHSYLYFDYMLVLQTDDEKSDLRLCIPNKS